MRVSQCHLIPTKVVLISVLMPLAPHVSTSSTSFAGTLLSLWVSRWFSFYPSLSLSLSLFLRLSLALSGSLWLSLALSGPCWPLLALAGPRRLSVNLLTAAWLIGRSDWLCASVNALTHPFSSDWNRQMSGQYWPSINRRYWSNQTRMGTDSPE